MKPRGRRLDPAQQKARKQRKILIGACILLFALMAFELPKLMKHKSAPAAVAAAPAVPAPSGDPAASASVGQPVSAAVNPARLPNEGGPTASDGQLVTFSLFKSKDPFVQQLSTDAGSTGGTSTSASTPPASTTPVTTSAEPPASTPPVSTPPVSSPPATSPTVTTPTETTPSTTPPTSTTPTTTSPTPEKPKAPTSATISVNGNAETVALAESFPKAAPLFTLVSLKDGIAHIGIAGGTLEGSSETVPLVMGKTLTLMNTADGQRYVLKLVALA